MKVSVTGVGSLFGQGIVKSLRLGRVAVRLQGFDYFDAAVGLRWVDEGHLLPDVLTDEVDTDTWFDILCDHVSAHGSELLFVGVDFELPLLGARARQLHERTGCRAVLSPLDVIELCRDKYLTAQRLRELGLPAPQSLLPDVGVDRLADILGFPIVVKPRTGSRGRDVVVVHDRDALASALHRVPDPVVQEFIEGDDVEFSCGVLVLGGRVDAVSVLRRRLKDGNTVEAWSESHPDLEDLCSRVALALGADGPMNIQLRVGPSGPSIFEINPRFSGTTVFRAHLGTNEPERILRHHRGEALAPAARLLPGRILRYYDELIEIEPGPQT